MLSDRIEKLKREYTGQRVVIDTQRPDMAQFDHRQGLVRTVNFNGRALVQFDGSDRGAYDVELDYVKVIDEPKPEPAESKPKQVPAKSPKTKPEPQATEQLSRLELARMEKTATEKPPEPATTGHHVGGTGS